MPEILAANLDAVRGRLAAAAAKWGRNPQDIRLLAISKQQSADAIREVARCGQAAFGESYLQEALPKMEALSGLGLEWHFIGQLQSNKTRPIAEQFAWVHTVDRLKIAQRLSEQRPTAAPPLNVCIQVRLADEPGKGGVSPADTMTLAGSIAALPNLRLRGLMCIPPPAEEFSGQRGYFDQCAALLERLNADGMRLDTLSMGMSADLEAAVAAGATIVRVGTAIFGERHG